MRTINSVYRYIQVSCSFCGNFFDSLHTSYATYIFNSDYRTDQTIFHLAILASEQNLRQISMLTPEIL